MNTEIKNYADNGDIKSLKYIFVDSLDVDPTFVRYEEEYTYCRSIPGLLEAHEELTPFRENQEEWDEDYWTSLKMDLIKNFSDVRMSHMREVAQVFLSDKLQRILAERAAGRTVQNAPAPSAESMMTSGHRPDMIITNGAGTDPAVPSKAAEQARRIEEEKRALEAENSAHEALMEREENERAARREQQLHEQEQATVRGGGNIPKKAIGIAAVAATAVVAVAVILFLLLK